MSLRLLFVIFALIAGLAPAQVITALKSYRLDNKPVLPPDHLVRGEDGTLYGMNLYALYKLQPDGSGFSILKQFPIGSVDFLGRPALSGSTLYVATRARTVFKINTDGSGYTVLKENILAGNPSLAYVTFNITLDPPGVVLSGNALYGWGFKINTDGTGYTELPGFPNEDGLQDWYKEFTVSGDKIFGSTSRDGQQGVGTVFRLNTDGTGYTVLVNVTPEFALGIGGPRLKVIGNTLYGHGWADKMFKVGTDGTGYTVLRNENLPRWNNRLEHSDGVFYWAAFVVINDRVIWSIFRMNPDGTGYAELRHLTANNIPGGGCGAGDCPRVEVLAVAGGTIYGLARAARGFEGVDGLDGGGGGLFRMNTDGSGFAVLHEFMPLNLFPDGRSPGPLTVSDGVLYGSDFSPDGNTRVFKMNTDGTGFTPLLADSVPEARLAVSGSLLFGLLSGRPLGNDEYSNARVFRMNTDGTGLTVLKTFIRSVDGNTAKPSAGVAVSGSTLYGTIDAVFAPNGSPVDSGKVFRLNTDGTGYTILHTFSLTTLDPVAGEWINGDGVLGTQPSELTVHGNMLYGTAFAGGQFGYGTVFKLNTDGSGFTVLKHSTPQVPHPREQLTLAGDTLYGISARGREDLGGAVFRVNTNGTGFMVVKQFPDAVWDNGLSAYANSEGVNPILGLALHGNTLYGTTSRGGRFGTGTLFKVNTDGTGFAVLEHIKDRFANPGFEGSGLRGLVVSGSTLYGSVPSGGEKGAGGIYSIELAPALSIARTPSGAVAVSWPSAWMGVQLQQSTNSLNSWSSVIDPIEDNGTTSRVTFPIIPGSRFFRLIQR